MIANYQIPVPFAKTMKSVIKFTALLPVLFILAGCASSGMVHNASPITAKKPDLDVIFVKTSSSLGGLEAEKLMLNDRIVSG